MGKPLPKLYGGEKSLQIDQIVEWIYEHGHPETELKLLLDRLSQEDINEMYKGWEEQLEENEHTENLFRR